MLQTNILLNLTREIPAPQCTNTPPRFKSN